MNWPALAAAVVAQRVALGYGTQKAFAKASGIGLRTISDLEAGERTSYSASTLARLERALSWQQGRVKEILAKPADADPSWLSTREGIYRHLYRDDMLLTELLYRSGLSDAAKTTIIFHIRIVRERQNADLLADVAARIRDLGGWAPEQPYPPTWLAEG